MDEEIMPIGVVVSGSDPISSLQRVKSLGIPTCQMRFPAEEWWHDPKREQLKKAMERTGIKITTMFCAFPGESYHDIPTIRRTVGLVNPKTREERVEMVFRQSDFARELGVKVLAAHIGFIPEDTEESNYHEIVRAVQRIAQHCQGNGQYFALETGQEKAAHLQRFIQDVNYPNIRVNFDPANMLLYDSGDPMEALDLLKDYIIGIHCKDGKLPERKGELGKEYPLGQGEVDIERFIKKLKEIGYTGPLTIEREISGQQQTRDILKAKALLEKLRRNING